MGSTQESPIGIAAIKRISIVVPVLDEEEALRRHLPRLQSYRKQGHEVIIADGGSLDGSVGACDGMVDQVVHSERGRARQMNSGAVAASGTHLLFLHIDTVLPEGADLAIASALAGTGTVWGRFDVRLSGTHPAFRMIETMINLRSRISGVATGDQAMFVAAADFWRVGGFPDIPLMEDVALSKALRKVARPVCLRSVVTTSSRRWEMHGITRTILLMWWLRLLYFCGVSPCRLRRMYAKE